IRGFVSKSEIVNLKIYGLDSRGANILKQEFLSSGGDVAVNRDVASWKTSTTDCLLMGTRKVYLKVLEKISNEPYFGLKQVYSEVSKAIASETIPSYRIRGRWFDFESRRYIMGILNVTPDSFSDGGQFLSFNDALRHANEMIEDGADIIDVGGESTRPGADPVSESEEIKRVIPVIDAVRKSFPDIPISIDTYKSKVAEEALKSGADIINDISGFRFDEKMTDIAARFNAPVIVMHIKGTPKDMQQNPEYKDLMRELLEYFQERIPVLESRGVKDIIIDPGIGFGKRAQDNLNIIRNLKELTLFNKPILIGLSNKSFIGKITSQKVNERLFGTVAANAIVLCNGANIVRVHDVKPHREMLQIIEAIEHPENIG
ncbi:MAG: dihydropteroate synthase, partial [Caldisericaceae bacterium]